MIVRLTREAIPESEIVQRVTVPEAGAVLTFRGVVRNHHQGRAVRELDYTAYPEMALIQMRSIAESIRERWPIHDVAIVHRLGTLSIGEASVFIALSLAHRESGFEALKYAIDVFKEIVPIWKKEHFMDGESEWVHQGV